MMIPEVLLRLLKLMLLRYQGLAIQWNIPGIDTNPAAGVKLFDPNNERERFLTPEETQRLFDVLGKNGNRGNTQLKYIVPLLLLLGCRKSELLESQWAEFDLTP